jgi:hypothetical protein
MEVNLTLSPIILILYENALKFAQRLPLGVGRSNWRAKNVKEEKDNYLVQVYRELV